ncbi:MAG: FadR/GntR family transcriptional regulator [Pseudomonadota bacterium]
MQAADKSERRGNLAEKIEAELRAKFASGAIAPGDKLPTEAALSQSYSVSRTVVREALAGLRADGLVVARQGSGVFAADVQQASERVLYAPYNHGKLSSIIEVLELRAAVESEAAALAAVRSSPAEVAKLEECHLAVRRALEDGSNARREDYAFHLAIAQSTHNTHFVEFFRFLGSRTIPREQPEAASSGAQPTRPELRQFHIEHGAVVSAIVARDADAAHVAMRDHLKASQRRYARLARSAREHVRI